MHQCGGHGGYKIERLDGGAPERFLEAPNNAMHGGRHGEVIFTETAELFLHSSGAMLFATLKANGSRHSKLPTDASSTWVP